MNPGRFTLALLAAAAIASAIAGCGSKDSTSSASATPPTDSATATPKSSGDAHAKRNGSASGFSAPKASSDLSSSEGASPKAPRELTKTETNQVKLALKQLMIAFSKDDVDYLCDQAFSKEFLTLMTAKGGCKKTLTTQLSSVNGFSAKVQSMVWIDKNLVAASIVLKRDTSATLQKNPATLYFTKQDGSWKRTAPPAT
jgi:hypothetical protein